MTTLNKNQILDAPDSKVESFDVPEWGGTTHLRTMTGAERDAFEGSIVTGDGKARNLANIRARLLVKTICDENGQRLFEDADAPKLGAKSAAVLERLFVESQRMNRIGAKDVAELVGNSEAGQSGGSTSA